VQVLQQELHGSNPLDLSSLTNIRDGNSGIKDKELQLKMASLEVNTRVR
jgi:hypothetical protein